MKKESTITYLVLLLIFAGFFIFLYFAQGKITGFSVYEQSTQSDFNNGTYSNTAWNGSAVVLNSGQTSGNYLSKIFDAGINSTWNNLSWTGGTPSIEFLFAVDGSGAVYKSTNQGVSWTQTVSNYGRTTDTIDMFSDSRYLYVLSNVNKEVWRSSNLGVNFSVINKTLADNNLFVGWKDSSGNLFAVDGSGDVYKSVNQGVSWILQGDFNGVATNNAKGIAINSNEIFIVDGSGAVYKSVNQGVSWTTQNSSYGGSTGTDDMVSDGTSLYILLNKQIYNSINEGVFWNIVNNSFTFYLQDGFTITSDSSGNLYILDGNGRVWKSTNAGVSWTEIGDFNGVATNNAKGFTNFIQQTNLSFQIRNCLSSDCSDGIWQIANLNNLALYGRYFQYSVNFSTPDSGTTPYLKSVSINYAINNSAPSLSVSSPHSASIYSNNNISLNFLVSDLENNLDSCWYEFEAINHSILNCKNTTFVVSGNGNYNLIAYANDSLNSLNSSQVTFTIDTLVPSLTINSPSAQTYTTSSILFNATSIDATTLVSSCWYTINSGATNQTLSREGTTNFYNFTQTSITDSSHTARFYCNDSANNVNNSQNVLFTIDTSVQEASSGSGGGSHSKKLNSSATEILENNKTLNVKNFSNNLINEQIEISLINVNRRKGFVDAEYLVKNLAEEDKNVDLYFSILDINESVKSEIQESQFISANSEKNFGITIPIDKELRDELVLIIDFKKYSSISENAPIRSPVSGFSIVNAEKNKNNLVAIIVLSLSAFVIILFGLYKIIRRRNH